MDDIILVGFGGHAKSVIDSIEKSNRYCIIGYTDIAAKEAYRGYKYLGSDDVLQEYYDKGVRFAFITVGYMGRDRLRDSLYKKLKEIGFQLPVIVDPTAVLAEDAAIGEGTFIGKNCIINSAVNIGKMCIINTGAVIEHENQIDDFTHVAVCAVLCGKVLIAAHCFIGANTTLIQNIKVGEGSVIGAGSIILRDILPGEIVYGIVKKLRNKSKRER